VREDTAYLNITTWGKEEMIYVILSLAFIGIGFYCLLIAGTKADKVKPNEKTNENQN
jgi:hypothetical protein